RLYAPAEFKDFKDGDYISKLQSSIDAYNAVQNSTNLTAVSGNISTLSNQLTIISDKPVQIEAGAGVVVGIPSKSFGGAFYATGWAAMGGEIKYRDNQNLQDFVTASNHVATTINTSCGGTVSNSPACLTGLSLLQSDPALTGYFTVNATTGNVTSSFDTNNSLQSKVDIRGVTMGEMGFAFAKQMGEGTSAWGLGVTPKLVKVNLYDYSVNVDSSTSTPDGKDYTAEYSHFNFDVGAAKNYGDGWRSGFVIKNVIPHTYDFKRIANNAPPGSAKITTGEIKLNPQARLGASHTNSWSTVAMDLDLTANNPAGLEKKSQYLALGAELNAWDWAQLRFGYRANLKDSKRNIPSVGVGLAPFGTLHIDAALSYSSNEIGASARLALTF
ncbi:MAG: conjugal transfer protein TraF, partial [Gallionella sp.]|nr:conjugal transfer protein TraF [Gallionella sp.]